MRRPYRVRSLTGQALAPLLESEIMASAVCILAKRGTWLLSCRAYTPHGPRSVYARDEILSSVHDYSAAAASSAGSPARPFA